MDAIHLPGYYLERRGIYRTHIAAATGQARVTDTPYQSKWEWEKTIQSIIIPAVNHPSYSPLVRYLCGIPFGQRWHAHQLLCGGERGVRLPLGQGTWKAMTEAGQDDAQSKDQHDGHGHHHVGHQSVPVPQPQSVRLWRLQENRETVKGGQGTSLRGRHAERVNRVGGQVVNDERGFKVSPAPHGPLAGVVGSEFQERVHVPEEVHGSGAILTDHHLDGPLSHLGQVKTMATLHHYRELRFQVVNTEVWTVVERGIGWLVVHGGAGGPQVGPGGGL